MNNNNVLFQYIEDFFLYVPQVATGVKFEKIQLNCVNANNKYLLKVIDKELFSSEDEDILEYLKHAQANYCAYEMTKTANATLTKQGNISIDSENMKPNFGEKQDLLVHYSETADSYLDLLLAYLKENNIDNSKEVSTVFFSSIEDFEEYKYLANSYRTFIALKPYINKQERLFILPKIGDQLDNILTSPTLISLKDAIRGFVANSAVLSAISHLKLRYSDAITVSTFISPMQEKFNKDEMKEKKLAIEKDIKDYSCKLDEELKRLFAVENIPFENKTENKGFCF